MAVNCARVAAFACLLVLIGCPQQGVPEQPPSRVQGQVASPGTLRGDAYVFLFAPGDWPPQGPAAPRYATAVPEVRLEAGDPRFLFSEVAPGPYRLWGFLDANRDVDLAVDVLAQPGTGDWVAEAAVELEVPPGGVTEQALTLAQRMRHGPPAFRVAEGQADGGVVTLTDEPLGESLTVEADGLGLLRGEEARFTVRLRDADGDGTADDLNGDGIPELFPQFFLSFVPRPGQVGSAQGDGGTSQIIVPLLINPVAFLPVLQGDVTREVSAASLALFVVPQAQAVSRGTDGGQALVPLGAIPVGEYQLWALSAEGAFWYVPNALGQRASEPLRSQALRFRIRRSDSP